MQRLRSPAASGPWRAWPGTRTATEGRHSRSGLRLRPGPGRRLSRSHAASLAGRPARCQPPPASPRHTSDESVAVPGPSRRRPGGRPAGGRGGDSLPGCRSLSCRRSLSDSGRTHLNSESVESLAVAAGPPQPGPTVTGSGWPGPLSGSSGLVRRP